MFETDALYQNDPRWKNTKLGNQSTETIGSWGCLMTSLAMVANGYGFDETPESINNKMKAAGGFQGAMIIPAVLPNICPGLLYKGYQPCEDTPAPMTQIDAALDADKPVIAQVDWSPKAGLQTHWILLYQKSGGDYYMKDPYRYSGDSPDKKLKVLDRYTHAGKDISKAITGVIWFEGSSPPEPKPKIAVPSDSFSVYATEDGLAFRTDSAVSADLIRRLPLNAKFETLESKSEANRKIGANNEWLYVQDSNGDQGYVAAWYISKTVVVQEPESAKPFQDEVEFYLIPIADGLAVRSAPQFDAQLITRVPLNTKFGYLESRQTVNQKVGKFNQWIHVYDENGLQGYTAAWYVTLKAGIPPQPPDDLTPAVEKTKPPAIVETPKPISGFSVVPTTDGLAFRSSADTSTASLIKRLPLATTLAVAEPDDQAQQKVGVYGQWLKVRDASGQIGYVAAWYVKAKRQNEDGDNHQGSEGLTVWTITEGVALRRSTVIADHTLIKRLPNNSPVLILEEGAKSKIGVNGQWLKVRDTSGTEGFIAAWYVKK
jgi:uncharacterized protein YgiM (DUF1202 family)